MTARRRGGGSDVAADVAGGVLVALVLRLLFGRPAAATVVAMVWVAAAFVLFAALWQHASAADAAEAEIERRDRARRGAPEQDRPA